MNHNKIVIYLVCLCISIIGILVWGIQDQNRIHPPYSTLNREDDGCKVLYYVTKEYFQDVSRIHKPAATLNKFRNKTMIIIEPDMTRLHHQESEALYQFVTAGNSLIVIAQDEWIKRFWIKQFSKRKQIEEHTTISIGTGKLILLFGPEMYTNKQMGAVETGIGFIRTLQLAGNPSIVFNEAYRVTGNSLGLIDMMGSTFYLMLIQGTLALIIFMMVYAIKGRISAKIFRKEKIIEIDRIVEREKKLKKEKAQDVILESYREKFFFDLTRYLGLSDTEQNRNLLPELIKSNRYMSSKTILKTLKKVEKSKNKKYSLRASYSLLQKMEEIRIQLR